MHSENKKEPLNTLAIRLREALQAREDTWDKQLEADIKAGKLEHLREDARRAKKAGKLKVPSRWNWIHLTNLPFS